MAATTKDYRTPHTSERTFSAKNLCRLLVLVGARAHETNGEQIIRKNGQPYTHTGRRGLAAILRKYAAQARGEDPLEAKGFNRSQALYAYRKAFPTGKAAAADLTPDEMKAASKAGYFISVSGNTDDVPAASKLDDHVNDVAHEIGVLPYPTDAGPLVLEPMRPQGAGLIRVSWSDLRKFTSEFKDSQGRRHCIKVKAGYDTAKARRARELNVVIDAQGATIVRLRDTRNAALRDLTQAQAEVSRLSDQLADSQAGTANAKAAGWESAHVGAIEWHQQQRTAGPTKE